MIRIRKNNSRLDRSPRLNQISTGLTIDGGRPARRVARRNRRAAYTLVEVLVAISVSAVLLLGLGSVMTLSLRTLSLRDSAAAETSRASQLVSQITADLKLALDFRERTASAVTFTVPDRDNDSQVELIRYVWTGSPDNQLLKTLDLSGDPTPATSVVIAENVTTFDLTYLLRTWGPAANQSAMAGVERVLVKHDDMPEPNGNGTKVVFVVVNKNSLTAQETARKNLMESWDFDVRLIDQNETHSKFDSELSGRDLVYVSQQVNETILGTKLNATVVGVVNEKLEMADDFGLGIPQSSTSNGHLLKFNAGTHFTTSSFPSGVLSLFNSNQPMTGLSNNVNDRSPDLRILGQSFGIPSLVILNKNDELYGGDHNVPGILGNNTAFPTLAANGILGYWQAATQVTLNRTATLESICAYVNVTASSQLRYGIYTDMNGEPGTLIAETSALSVPTGGDPQLPQTDWYTIALTQPTQLSPGTYWLAMALPQEISYYYESNAGQTRTAITGSDPLQGLMSSWSGTYPGDNNRRISIYANYLGAAQAPGRRIQLPWGGTGFDINSLNNEGKTLFEKALLWAGDQSPLDGASDFEISNNQWAAQYFSPSLPANATGWSLMHAFVAIKPNSANGNSKVRFRLQSANLNQQPGPTVIQETEAISLSSFATDKYVWYEIPFRETKQFLPTDGICLVVKGTSATADAEIKLDINQNPMTGGTHFMSTTNQGLIWSTPNNNGDLRFYIFGKHHTQGEPAPY